MLDCPGANVNQAADNNSTALGQSCRYGILEVVRLLLQQPKIDVDQGADGWSPLAIALDENNHEIVQLLMKAKNYLTRMWM